MKTLCPESSGFVYLTRAEDGVTIRVPDGTDVLVLDDIGDKRALRNQHMAPNDWPCMFDDVLYFVDRREIVGRRAYEQHAA